VPDSAIGIATDSVPDSAVGIATDSVPDSAVGIATRYGLDGPGIESRYEARFFAPVQTDSGTQPTSCIMGIGSFQEVKRPGRGVDHPPHVSSRLKKEWGYTSTPTLDIRYLFLGDLYLYFYCMLLTTISGPGGSVGIGTDY
jgi:hypothetical protein